MKRVYSNKTQGFTLVELLVVMLVLVALSSITLDFTQDFAFQGRYEVTKDRYEKIKRAIIGRPDVLINGQPDISGFVADVGRLPFALQELIDGNHCPDTQYFTSSTCNTALGAGSWVATPNWNGPYISTNKVATDDNALSDGWGNSGAGNYGWTVTYYTDNVGTTATTTITSALSMKIQSPGSSSSGAYGAVYPNPAGLINDWRVTPQITIEMHAPTNFTECDITSISNQSACEASAAGWMAAHCEDTSKTTSATCNTLPFIWDSTFSVCVDTSKATSFSCAVLPFNWKVGSCRTLDSGSCSANWMRWSASTCTSTSKAFCDAYIGSTSYQTQLIDIILTYNDGAGGTATLTQTATVIENGRNQLISLTGFSSVPMGDQSILITKSGTSNIYPPSCLGLEASTDCADAGGTLLSNNICDDITITQCEAGASGTGTVTRNIIQLPFIPRKPDMKINW